MHLITFRLSFWAAMAIDFVAKICRRQPIVVSALCSLSVSCHWHFSYALRYHRTRRPSNHDLLVVAMTKEKNRVIPVHFYKTVHLFIGRVFSLFD